MIDDASHRLRDAGVLWVLDGSFDRVVDAAVACLVAGTSSYSLDMLAGASASDPYAERLELVEATLAELGLPPLPHDPDDLAREGARIQMRALSAGALTPIDLGDWVTGRLTCQTRARVEDALAAEGPSADAPPR